MSENAATGLLAAARLDTAAVAEAIRDELGRRSDGAGRPAPAWVQLEADLEVAENNAPVGLKMPDLPRFRGLKRRLLLFAVKCLFAAAHFITSRQRQVNTSLVSCLRGLLARTRRIEEEQARLEALLAEQAARIGELETALSAQGRRKAG
jgi:hypothetical protein